MREVMHEELAHGLRTPLTSVLGYSSTLLDRWDELNDDERMAFVRIVYGEALRMAHSVEQVDRQLYHEFAGRSEHSHRFKPPVQLADARSA
jgi:signal transduction histidine kinase